MNHIHAPLFQSLIKLTEQEPVSFHVPGHRYGHAFDQLPDHAVKEWYSSIMKLDVTELSITDDLHHPEASIAEAQHLAAKSFGAKETFFLVGGSTSGNIGLLLAVCEEPAELIIVQRNVHKSVINGLKLANARAVFVMPQNDEQTGVATIPSIGDLEDVLIRHPEAKAVFLSNPNYYGMSSNMKAYADLVHHYGKILLVDEAHGAHYGLHPELPLSAVQVGADAVVQSTHKTLTALTMGAMLHVQGDRLPMQAIRQSLSIIQSSSPSFPIMASLDISRAMIDHYGSDWFEVAIRSASSFRSWLLEQQTLPIQTIDRYKASHAYDQLDPLRIVIWDETGALSGYDIQRQLEQRGCWAEMADPKHVVLLFGVQINGEDVSKLIEACTQINSYIIEVNKTITNRIVDTKPFLFNKTEVSYEPVLFNRRNNNREITTVRLTEATGYQSAEMVVPYPPGIPILYPGEPLTSEIVDLITRLAEHGSKFQGAVNSTMQTIEVYTS